MLSPPLTSPLISAGEISNRARPSAQKAAAKRPHAGGLAGVQRHAYRGIIDSDSARRRTHGAELLLPSHAPKQCSPRAAVADRRALPRAPFPQDGATKGSAGARVAGEARAGGRGPWYKPKKL